MGEARSFQERLQAVLENRAQYLQEKSLPLLKNNLRVYQTLFENIYNILIRKSLIHEDPYKYDHRILELSLPPTSSFLESEKQEELSRRLSAFHNQLDFLNGNFSFNLESLSLETIKRILALVQYIQWQGFSGVSSSTNTAVLAEFVGRVRQGGDNISNSILSDSLAQLEAATRQILAQLKDLALFQREAYKLELRRRLAELAPDLLADRPGGPAAGVEALDKAVSRIKPLFLQQLRGRPFYPELVKELLAEESAENREEVEGEILARISPVQEKPAEVRRQASHKSILLEGIRILAAAEAPLSDALRKSFENKVLMENRRQSFGQRIRRWLEKLVRGGPEDWSVELEYRDAATGAQRTEKLDLNLLLGNIQNKAKLFAALGNKMSPAYRRLEAGEEKQLFAFLTKNIHDLNRIHRRLEALGIYFKNEMPQAERGKVKVVKIELAALKNCLIKVNKKKHEYASLKEEEEQMKKMGLSPEPG